MNWKPNRHQQCPSVLSNETKPLRNNNRQSKTYNILRCNSTNRNDQDRRYSKFHGRNIGCFDDIYKTRRKHLARLTEDVNCDHCYQSRQMKDAARMKDCEITDFTNDFDNAISCDLNFGERTNFNRYTSFDSNEGRYMKRKMNQGRRYEFYKDQERDKYWQDGCEQRENRCHSYRNRSTIDQCDATQKRCLNPSDVVMVHEVPHSYTQYTTNRPQRHREYRRNLKTCLTLKKKDQGAGDTTDACCTCKECPFCLLRLFCVEVLAELAEIKAKKIGEHLEGPIYAKEEGRRFRSSEVALSNEQRFSEDTFGLKHHEPSDSQQLRRKARSLEFGQNADRLDRKRENFDDNHSEKRGSFSTGSFEKDHERGRYGRDSDKNRSRKGAHEPFDDFDNNRRKREKKSRDKLDKKKERENEEEKKREKSVELPEEIKKELENAKKKDEREKQKRNEERSKKALIAERLMKSSRMATKSWAVKKYNGPGRFAEVNICDFMRLRLESILAREVTMQRTAYCPVSCMLPTCRINPQYCCSSFWCKPLCVPAICG